MGLGLVCFYGISTIVGYLMPNPVYSYILDICIICKRTSTMLHDSKLCHVSLTIKLNNSNLFPTLSVLAFFFLSPPTKSAGAVEYTDRFSAEG